MYAVNAFINGSSETIQLCGSFTEAYNVWADEENAIIVDLLTGEVVWE